MKLRYLRLHGLRALMPNVYFWSFWGALGTVSPRNFKIFPRFRRFSNLKVVRHFVRHIV